MLYRACQGKQEDSEHMCLHDPRLFAAACRWNMTVVVLADGVCAGAVLCAMECELYGLSTVCPFGHLGHALLRVLDTCAREQCWKLSDVRGARPPVAHGTRERTVVRV